MNYAPARFFALAALLFWMPLSCNTEDGALDPNGTDGSAVGGAIGTGDGTGGSVSQTGGNASGGNASGGVGAGGVAAGGVGAGGSTTGGKPGSGGTASGGSGGEPPCSSATCKGVCVAQDSLVCAGKWKCVNDPGVCTTDIAQFCGCDGKTFMSSSSCVPNAWAHRGTCEQGADCDQRKIQCRAATPECAPGYVPSVVGTCYGPCVKLTQCACTEADHCPGQRGTCSLVSKRCVAPVF